MKDKTCVVPMKDFLRLKKFKINYPNTVNKTKICQAKIAK